ncbi:MAG: hypothetical protein IJW86_04705 [Clostridia bacterium]|nr:hypothetical protein [Clostridia bacterium]
MNKIKSFFSGEIADLKSSVGKLEYASWWLLRMLMVGALIYKRTELGPGFDMTLLQLGLNLLASFTITLVRLILIPKKIVCKLPFRSQTYLNVLIFFASFCGHGLNCIHDVASWDKLMHLLTGFLFVFIGNELLRMFMRSDDKMSPLLQTFTAFGFSNIAIVIWEIFEFFVDYYWPESCNQAYNIHPDRDPWFFKIFGTGAQNENQWAVFDTCVDMLCAFLTSVMGAVILLVFLHRKEKKQIVIDMTPKETVAV